MTADCPTCRGSYRAALRALRVNAMPLGERIEYYWQRGVRNYAQLMLACFPDEKSNRVSQNGGPPGCAMAFGAALRRLGIRRVSEDGRSHGQQLVRAAGGAS